MVEIVDPIRTIYNSVYAWIKAVWAYQISLKYLKRYGLNVGGQTDRQA